MLKKTLPLLVASATALCALADVPVSAEAMLGTRSSFVNYGLTMGRDPIVVPAGRVTACGVFYLETFALMDTTKGNGKRGGYGNRAGEYRKLNTSIGARYGVPVTDSVAVFADLSYMYEYVPRYRGAVEDTQFINLKFALEGLWAEPVLAVERDFMLDGGTYVFAEVGHTFRIAERFSVRPSISQGFGDGKRTAGCFGHIEKVEGFDHAGLMDSSVRIDFGYDLTDWLKIGAFVAYHDYLFGDSMREAAAAFNGKFGAGNPRTWSFSGGVGLSVSF